MDHQDLIIGIDLASIKPIPNVIAFQQDITTDKCRTQQPPLFDCGEQGHRSACWHIDRMAEMRHQVADLRDMYANDLRFIEQF